MIGGVSRGRRCISPNVIAGRAGSYRGSWQAVQADDDIKGRYGDHADGAMGSLRHAGGAAAGLRGVGPFVHIFYMFSTYFRQ